GPVYQAGTLSGNPLAVAAGIKTLEIIRRPGFYDRLESLSAQLATGFAREASRTGVPLTINRVGSMLTAFFAVGPVTDYQSAKQSDTKRFGAFFRGLLDRGVYWPPSQFEAAFVSAAHTPEDVARTLEAVGEALGGVAAEAAV
ncbi:MAG TPA: aspartate aminotransferase family protein, partial [Terriglobia bacterium]|nr:aspartate aminotransferase family protein [Terriglobia bacterium]